MSEARKCDRCKDFYDIAEEQQDRDAPYEFKGDYINLHLWVARNGIRKEVMSQWYDLCPKCMMELECWLNNNEFPTVCGPDKDTDCIDRSNGATEKELELASKLNDAKIYIAQLKSELGYTMTKEEIEFMKGIHNFTDEDISEAAKFVETKSSSKGKKALHRRLLLEDAKLNKYGCPHDKCCDCPHFSKEPNPFNSNDHNGIYKCNDKNIYISGNCSRPNVSDMSPKDFCNLGCNFVKETTGEPEYKDPCKSCHNGVCEQCDYGYCSEEDKKKRWLENHKDEVKLSDPYEEGGL